MVWAYVVIMAMSTPVTSDTEFIVQAPNMAFKNEEDCQKFRELNMLRLYNSRPSENAKAISKCTSFPFNVDKGV